MRLSYGKIFNIVISIFITIGLVIPASAFADFPFDSSPDVWVIDSTYNNHGQTVSEIIRREAPNADVHFEAVSNSEGIRSSDVAAAIVNASNSGAEVINLSLGAPEMSRDLKEAIEYAQERGVTVVAAAGNDGGINYPAAYEGVVSVGALDSTGNRAYYSSAGDVYADGVAYNGMQGTSFAAPHIAGQIAQDMYNGSTAEQASMNVVNNNSRDTSGIIHSVPELTDFDVLLGFLAYALASELIRAHRGNNFAGNDFSSGDNNNYQVSNPHRYSKPSGAFNSGFFARELRGFPNESPISDFLF